MRIIDLYHHHAPVFSIEIFPPKTIEGVISLQEKLSIFQEYSPDFISVTYGAGGGTRQNTHALASFIKNKLAVEAMAHLTCVSHTREEIRELIDHLAEVNIENLMILRGDPPRGETQFKKPENGFEYASELITAVKQRGDFGIGAAGYPEGHPETPDPNEHFEHFLLKIEAGAQFIVTQFFLDNDFFFKWRDQVRSRGVTVPLAAGVMPALSATQITRFAKMCRCFIPTRLIDELQFYETDAEAMYQVGLDFARQQIEGLLKEGVDGIHLYALNRSKAVEQLAPLITNKTKDPVRNGHS